MQFSPAKLLAVLQQFPKTNRYIVAYSGGVDSRVLLEATASLQEIRRQATLEAVHVHHGLMAEAQEWVDHCRSTCNRLGVPLRVVHVDASPDKGQSREEVARLARYRALRAVVNAGDVMLLGQHQDDQAETVLLQLFRGAGLDGLAAMPACSELGRAWLCRPLLEYTRRDLEAYARANALEWIEDRSNDDLSLARNYLRHVVMAKLRERWPAVSRTVARSASHLSQAKVLFDRLAQSDLSAVQALNSSRLSISALRSLSPERQCNVIRKWLRDLSLPLPSQAKLKEVLTSVMMAAPDKTPRVRWCGAEVRRYRGELYALAPLPAHDPNMIIQWDTEVPLHIAHLNIHLDIEELLRAGLNLPPQRSAITIRFRRGGERCRPQTGECTRTLKKLFQEAGVPPWQRDRIPLLYVGEQLRAVVGHWICACGHAVPCRQKPVCSGD